MNRKYLNHALKISYSALRTSHNAMKTIHNCTFNNAWTISRRMLSKKSHNALQIPTIDCGNPTMHCRCFNALKISHHAFRVLTTNNALRISTMNCRNPSIHSGIQCTENTLKMLWRYFTSIIHNILLKALYILPQSTAEIPKSPVDYPQCTGRFPTMHCWYSTMLCKIFHTHNAHQTSHRAKYIFHSALSESYNELNIFHNSLHMVRFSNMHWMISHNALKIFKPTMH